ncbi:EamA-like transporter family protein [Breoghania corrubedonensis]|uniref:EamA-like transporter family protein n=1 Tax=Breoghania corrubedonensis TaxID=665038 RepID=A0A2T5VFQ1_9HYPH|nr:DMT family transporter [Breoghania corrubedonensis]PTW62568.1 EamA-like transporter family protein [Breoghania corrubedonensis]
MRALLFVATAVLWGSSAIVTGQQAISGAPEVSVGYRMALVSLAMFGWSLARGQSLGVRQIDRPWVVLQGVSFFGLAFITFYHATALIPSGIAALILSTSSLFAALVGWLFLSVPITLRMLAGIVVGIIGLAVIAAPQFTALSSGAGTVAGAGLALAAAACTGCGTVVAMRNQRAGIPISVLMSWAALCGALFSFALALIGQASFHVDVSLAYLAGLAYLAIIASCVTFFMYFSLVHRIGAASASYTLALVPVVALLLSALFENLRIDASVLSGGCAVLLGNILVLSSQAGAPARAKQAS